MSKHYSVFSTLFRYSVIHFSSILLYGFISWKLILVHLSVYLYNIGFGSVIILFFANFNRKRLDLSKGTTFNWQGMGATKGMGATSGYLAFH